MENQLKISHDNQEKKDYKISWSKEKFKEMESTLKGYWAEDVWIGAESPIKNQERTSLTLKFNHASHIIRTELKFALYTKIVSNEWGWGTVHVSSTVKDVLEIFQENKLNQDASIIDLPLDVWEINYKNYIGRTKKYSKTTKHRSIDKYGGYKFYEKEDPKVYTLRIIYRILESFYDSREEYEKDIWDINKIKPNKNNKERFMDFTGLKDSWLFQPARQFIKYHLATKTAKTCHAKLLYIRRFNDFLAKNYPQVTPQELDRQLILDYISFTQSLNTSYTDKHHRLSYLKEFLELCYRENWLNIPNGQLIYTDDFPKTKRTFKPNYIPDEVVRKIYRHIDKISSPVYGRMFLIQMQVGCRFSDLRFLKFECLTQTIQGQYILQYWNSKQSKQHSIPANNDLVSLIRIQQEEVRNKLGENFPYLFPSASKANQKKNKVVSLNAYNRTIKKLIYDNDIKDNNGKRWIFSSHQCRHSVATSMINDGVPAHIVQRYLGHDSPTMTQNYAHIHDQTLRKEIEKYHESRVVNFRGETAELDETTLSSSDDLEWFKKNVQGRALEHGYCARPKVLGNCDIPGFDGCYNCPHWRTNKNFLPVLEDTLKRTSNVLQKAENCGWQLQINKNTPIRNNLEKVIKSLVEDND